MSDQLVDPKTLEPKQNLSIFITKLSDLKARRGICIWQEENGRVCVDMVGDAIDGNGLLEVGKEVVKRIKK